LDAGDFALVAWCACRLIASELVVQLPSVVTGKQPADAILRDQGLKLRAELKAINELPDATDLMDRGKHTGVKQRRCFNDGR
jgi:hypothetical protein